MAKLALAVVQNQKGGKEESMGQKTNNLIYR